MQNIQDVSNVRFLQSAHHEYDSRVLDKISTEVNIMYKEDFIMKYVCDVCEWTYDEKAGDPDNGIAPGTKFEDLPEDFVCPLCGVGKESFSIAER